MEDLRSEIRAAFESEQAADPPVASMRHDVVRAVTSQPRRQRSLQWIAVAAVVLAVLVVAGLMSTRLAHQPTPSHKQPVGDYGPPPAGVSLLYLRDPNHPGWYTGFDWSGKPRGTIKLAQPYGPSLLQSPSGSFFAVSPTGKGDGGQLLDRLGNPISGTSGMWSDDSVHTCSVALDEQNFTWTLVTGGPNQSARNVALIARDSGIGQTGINVVACSFTKDRAIAVRESIMFPSEMWVVRLSDGQVLSHTAINNGPELANLVGSPDGTLVAENSRQSTAGLGTSTQPTVIRRLSNRSVVATLHPSDGVIAFSADDSRALITTSPWSIGGNTAHLAVIDLATGKTVWRYDSDNEFVHVFTEPGGAAFAIVLSGNGQVRDFPITTFIVYPDGGTVDLPAGYLRP